MPDTIAINKIKRMLGEKFIELGIAQTRDAVSDIPTTERDQAFIRKSLVNFGMSITFLDDTYYTTSFDNWKKIVEVLNPINQSFAWTKEWYDCLMPDTPLICKINDEICIKEVQELSENPENTFVLDENNQWTKINIVKSRISKKDIITIKYPEGFLETTEDHRFMISRNGKGEWVKDWTEIGKIEKDKEKFKKTHFINQDFSIFKNKEYNSELAYAYGIFLAEGHASSPSQWHIDMGEKEYLSRAKDALEKKYGIRLKIILYPSQTKGTIRGGIKSTKNLYRLKTDDIKGSGKKLSEIFRKLFYTDTGNKKIPLEIFDADNISKNSFLTGYIHGDGCKVKNHYVACCKSNVALLGLQILSKKVGIETSIYYDQRNYGNRKGCPVIAFFTERKIKRKINKPLLRRKNEGLVYDISTDSGHFFAGNYLVHNCDNRAMLMSSLIPVMYGLTTCSPCYCQVFDVSGKEIGWHYNNLIIDELGSVYLWDCDNFGTVQKITTNTPVMNNWKYKLSSIRPF